MVTGSIPRQSVFSISIPSKSHHVSRLIWTLAFVHPPPAPQVSWLFYVFLFQLIYLLNTTYIILSIYESIYMISFSIWTFYRLEFPRRLWSWTCDASKGGHRKMHCNCSSVKRSQVLGRSTIGPCWALPCVSLTVECNECKTHTHTVMQDGVHIFWGEMSSTKASPESFRAWNCWCRPCKCATWSATFGCGRGWRCVRFNPSMEQQSVNFSMLHECSRFLPVSLLDRPVFGRSNGHWRQACKTN